MNKQIFYSILLFSFSKCAIVPSIPSHLRDCYRATVPGIPAPRRLDVFLSLLRKLELNSQLDMRLFSTALLRSLRLDGVEQSSSNAVETEFILPYRASSFQFHKYKILMDIFLPSQNLMEVNETLSVGETCLLHRMLSSAVRQWERGDENSVCPLSAQLSQSSNNMETQSSGRIISRCPIEGGVILTHWGTVSAGTLVSAIAASLESQRVSVTDILNANIFNQDVAEPLMVSAKQEWYEDIETLNPGLLRQSDVADIGNVWVATLAGDLAEVVVNQGPRVGSVSQNMVIGSNNRWNDTLLPRDYYLFPRNLTVADWQFTDAEILAGIDGLILANYVPKWIEQRRTLRLSQIIDMYYSHEGVSFDPTVRACNRQNLFANLVNSTDLFTETSRFAYVLSLRQITVYIPVEEMERITHAAVTAFMDYAPSVLRLNHRDCQVSNSAPIIDLIVATDGSWRGYDIEQFMSWIGGSLEINLQRGSISLLHGNTGTWIAPPSYNLTTMFAHLTNYSDGWPNRLNLPRVMSTILQHSLNNSLEDIESGASAGPSTVVLIISPSDRPSSTEMERARELMTSLRANYFDVYFTYVAEDPADFQNINNEYLDYSELFLTTTSTSVQDVIEAVDTYLVKSNIPMRIIGAQCPFNNSVFNQVEYEDFVLPNRQALYRIHPFYLRLQSFIQVQFRNDGQGQLLVCMWRGAETSHSCQTIQERGLQTFNLTAPCASPDFCLPAHFTVTATSTANLCASTLKNIKMPLSGAERTQRYRERLKQNRPDEFERQKKQNLAKVKSKKKKVSELTLEEAEIRRERWRKEKSKSRQKQGKAKKHDFSQDNINSIPEPSSVTQQENLKYNLTKEKFIQSLRHRNKFLVNKYRNYTRQIENLRKKNETYRKRYQRLKQKKDKEIKDLNLQILKMKAREEILENTLKTTYQSCSKIEEKRTLKKLALNSGNKTMISKMLGLKDKARQNKKKTRRCESQEITKFYTRDDISRITAGKKEVRTKNKQKVQIRYLLDTLVNTFQKYKAENGRYGFTTFYKYKPFFVLSPGLSSRSTCLCIKHSNFGFLHSSMAKHGLLTGSIQDILSQVSCDMNMYECMWSKCNKCKNKKIQYHQISEEKFKQQVEWPRWERLDHTYQKKDGEAIKEITTKRMAKAAKKGTLKELKNDFERDLILFKKHYFNMKHQQGQYQKALLELKENEALIVCDFSENYQSKLAEEIQSMHYGASNSQICLHTGMVFLKNRSQSFCTLSDNTTHQPAAIWAHLTPILDMIKQESPETTILHFYSDGPSAQYRQKNNFYLLVYYTRQYQFQYTTWSFYEAGHGKNVADGIGGSIKRTLDRKVCTGNDVIDAKDAYTLLKQCLKVTKVFLIDSANVEKVAKNLPAKVPVLKGTMQLHQVSTSLNRDSNIIQYRDIGCFCGDLRGLCTCFSPKSHVVVFGRVNDNQLPIIRSETSNNGYQICDIVEDPCLLLEFSEQFNNTDQNIDLDAIGETDLIFRAEDAQHPSQAISVENTQGSPVFNTEICLFENAVADTVVRNANISEPLKVVNVQPLNIKEEKRNLGQKQIQGTNKFQSHYVNPKKEVITILKDKRQPVIFLSPPKDISKQSSIFSDLRKEVMEIPPKRRPIELLGPIKDHSQKPSVIIHNVTVYCPPVPSTAKNKVPTEKHSTIKDKQMCQKPKYIKCRKCLSSIFGERAKCISCKNWFCSECIGGSESSDYICEICLED